MSDADRWVHTDKSSQLISGTLNEDRRALMEEIAKETTAQRKPQRDEEPQLGVGMGKEVDRQNSQETVFPRKLHRCFKLPCIPRDNR